MATVTKKELIDQIALATGQKRVVVKRTVQTFLDSIIVELGKGNRLEFRDFGVFEVKQRQPRKAQNPKTLEPVEVPAKRTVKFKVGRMMKLALAEDETLEEEADPTRDGDEASEPDARATPKQPRHSSSASAGAAPGASADAAPGASSDGPQNVPSQGAAGPRSASSSHAGDAAESADQIAATSDRDGA